MIDQMRWLPIACAAVLAGCGRFGFDGVSGGGEGGGGGEAMTGDAATATWSTDRT
jgi:hypothetical protein